MEKIIYIRNHHRHELVINPNSEHEPGEVSLTNLICELIIENYAGTKDKSDEIKREFFINSFIVFENSDVLLIG